MYTHSMVDRTAATKRPAPDLLVDRKLHSVLTTTDMRTFLVAALLVSTYHTTHTHARVATYPVEDVVSLESDAVISSDDVGKIVFLTSSLILPSSAALRDDDFQIRVPGVLRMRRYSEFCQWNETVTPSEEDPESNTYEYEKVWHGEFINSKNFAKRRKHKNWQKSPFPNKKTRSKSAFAGAYTLSGNLVAKLDDAWSYWTPTPEDLTGGFLDSIATRHTFVCLGSRYFFKAFDDKRRGTIMEKAALVINGQPDPRAIVELFGDCQSGDIRTAFDVIRPSHLSTLARLVDADGTLDTFEFEGDKKFGDIRTAFDVIRPSHLSILARLVDADGTLDTFEFEGDKKFGIVRKGMYTLENFLSGGPPIDEPSDSGDDEHEEL